MNKKIQNMNENYDIKKKIEWNKDEINAQDSTRIETFENYCIFDH